MTRKLPPDPFDSNEELIFIDPKAEVFEGRAVIGPGDIEFYKDAALKQIVAQIIKKIPPQMVEANGYEMVTYKLIVKEYKK